MNSICQAFEDCSSDIQQWITKQPEVKEESITDRLLYELSEKIPTLKYKQFTRTEEGRKTGADWEWWFIFSNKESFGARIQAKKLKDKVDNYAGIAYVSNDRLQIERLLEDSANDGLASFYSFYTSQPSDKTMCRAQKGGVGIFLSEANKLRDEFILQPRKKLAPIDIIKFTNPISCLFCCPLTFGQKGNIQTGFREHLKRYFPGFSNNKRDGDNQEELGFMPTPNYILQFLSNNVDEYWETEYRTRFEKTNAIVVIDLRDEKY